MSFETGPRQAEGQKQGTVAFVAVLVGAMVVSTFQLFALIIIAADLIEELNISRWDVGLLGAANTGVGAVLAPRLGVLTDQLGARRSVGLIFGVSGVGLILSGIASAFWMLLVGSAVCGLGQGWSNTATNKLIAARRDLTDPGVITGLKQSGVQLSGFLAGIVMPLLVLSVGWHRGLVVIGVLTLAVGGWSMWSLDADAPTSTQRASADRSRPLPIFVYQVAVYALLMGLASGGVGRFLPLFAQEELAFSLRSAGYLVAFQGALGIIARLMWGRAADTVIPLRLSLLVMAVGGVVVFGMLLSAGSIGGGILWVAAALMAFTTSAWNVVANLSMIKRVRSEDAGRATGVMMMSFLAGLTISGPIAGWAVDRTGGYSTVWLALMLLAFLGALSVSRELSERTDEALPPIP